MSGLAPYGITLGMALGGALLYALSGNAKAAEIGRLVCVAGLFAFAFAAIVHVAVR